MTRPPVSAMHRERGVALVEVLVSLLICAFGLLGFVALQARATSSEYEALQRSQALVLLDDMVSRLNANRPDAEDYVSAGLIGVGDVEDCDGLTGADLDLCEWGNLLRGSTETRDANRVGSMVSARGCISKAPGADARYIVAVAWMGNDATGAPASACGQGDAAFPDERLRRVVSTSVCIGWLNQPVPLPAEPAC
jgi:type IV pilus assembly protein PilV